MNLTEQLKRFVRPMKNQIMNMVGKCIIVAVNDSTAIQLMKVDLGNKEIRTDLERVQDFGFTSNPKDGAQALALFLNGSRDHGVVIAVDDGRYRIHLDKGESAMYNAFGDKITMKANGDILVDATRKVIINGAQGIELIGVPAGLPIGVVVQTSVCAFTGGPHPMGSSTVKSSP